MKNLAIKADRMVLDLLTRIILRWMEKRDRKKHKYDFKIRFGWVQLWAMVIWTVALPTAVYIKEGHVLAGAIAGSIWLMICGFEWWALQQVIHRQKPTHDMLYSLREREGTCEMYGEVLEEMFVADRRGRILGTAAVLGVTAFLAIATFLLVPHELANLLIWQFLVCNAVANRVKDYITYVNDFNKPKKKKTAVESITDLLSSLWHDLANSLTPQPALGLQQL